MQRSEEIKQTQRDLWNAVAAAWERWWHIFENSARPASQLLVEMAHIGPGSRVLDLATGIGEPAVTAALVAGPGGHVIATDQAVQMVELGRKRAAAQNLANIEFRVVDAEEPDLPPASFDAVTCRWGLMFVPDPQAAIGRIRRLLKPGGWLATEVWAEASKVPMVALGRDRIDHILGSPPRDANTPDPLRLHDIEAVKKMFEAAGFSEISSRSVVVPFEFASPEAFVEFRQATSAIIMTRLATATPETRAAAIRALLDAARDIADKDGHVRLPSETVCIAGRA